MNVLVLHLVSVLLLAVLVEVACRLGRFRPAICHALWLVVLMKLIVPPVVAWPVNTQVLAYFAWDSPSPNRDPIDATRQSTRQAESTLRGEFGVYRDGEAFTILIPHSESSISWMMVVGFLWGGGGFVSLVQIVREVSRAKNRIAAGEALPEWLQAQLAQSCALLGVPAPRAVIVREVGGVYMQITGRPTLVISAEALEHVGAEHWHTILTHELAHLKRRDHWVAWIMLAAGVAWWWNPCFWWVRNRVHLYSEMACDAWVVNVHPGDRKQYAETMVRIMAMLSRQDTPAPAMGLAAWSAATQERRLWMIMKAKGGCRVPWLGAAWIIAIAIIAVPGCRSINENGEADATAKKSGWVLSLAPSKSLQEKLDLRVRIEFEDIHVKDIFEFVHDSFELNVVLDERVIKPYQEEWPPDVRPRPEVRAEPVPDAPKGGKPYVTDGIVTEIVLMDNPLMELVTAIASPLHLIVQPCGHSVWLSTPEQIALDKAVPLPSADFDEGPILVKLKSPINVEFEDIHINDAVLYMHESFGVRITLDGRVVMPEGKDWNTPPLGSPGYATDGMLGYINLTGIPMGEALYHMTRLLNLTYTVKEDHVYISTPELIDRPEVAPAAE